MISMLSRLSPCFLLVFGLLNAVASAGNISNFSTWSLVQDPADPNLIGSFTSTTATLSALGGPIARGTDVGFASTNGNTVAGSTYGNFFSPDNDFEIAIDYSLSFIGADGVLGLGAGIGEEASGENSAGIAFLTGNGVPIPTFVGAARVNDADLFPKVLALAPSLSGSLFIEFDAASGDITVGAAATPGALSPTVSGTFQGLQDQWNDKDLLASFFIRSELTGWDSGEADAVFSNFRVLQGSATSVPEPSAFYHLLAMVVVGGVMTVYRRRRNLAP